MSLCFNKQKFYKDSQQVHQHIVAKEVTGETQKTAGTSHIQGIE